MRDIINSVHLVPAFAPKAAVSDNTAQVSTVIDTAGYDSVALALVTGVLTDADATFAVLIEESDAADLSGSNVVDPNDLNGTVALASFDFSGDGVCRKIGYVGNRRYVRATVTPSNNTGNLFMSGMWLLAEPRNYPTPNPPV